MFGSWKSPISSEIIAEKKIRIQEIEVGGKENNFLFWIERRPSENGRNSLTKLNLKNKEEEEIK